MGQLKAELEAERERTRRPGETMRPIQVYGFKNVKGLEFEDVAIIDFFCMASEINELQHKSWKFALRRFSGTQAPNKPEPDGFPVPEMEMQMKVLYTSITRTRTHLFLIERNDSPGGKAWYDHLKEGYVMGKDGVVVKGEPHVQVLEKMNFTEDMARPMLPDELQHEGTLLSGRALLNVLTTLSRIS